MGVQISFSYVMNTLLISKIFLQFGVRDKDAVLPNYCIKRVRFTFEKEPEGKVMKVDFKGISNEW